MGYTVEHLESTRMEKLPPLNVFRAVLAEMLGLTGQPVRLLDCGCGTGFFTRQYARLPGVSAVGVDLDETLLSAARTLAEREGLAISFEQGDVTALPYQNCGFDAVTGDIFLEIFPDKTVPIGEMVRVCRPGGRVLCIEPNYRSTVYCDPRLSQEDNEMWAQFHRLGRAFGAGPELPDAMDRAGLEDIQLVPWLWGGLERSGGEAETERFLQERSAGLDTAVRMGAVSGAEAETYRSLFQRTAAARRSGNSLVLGGIDLYLVCGRKPAAK